MLSYARRMDLARRFVVDVNISEEEHPNVPTYVVKDVAGVIAAYAEDLESIDAYDNDPADDVADAICARFDGESVGEFLTRHKIEWD